MVDVNKMCELVTKATNFPYIANIIDIGHSFVIFPLEKDGEFDEMPLMFNKKKGIVEACYYPDYFNEISKGISIEIPEKYQFKQKPNRPRHTS